MLHCGTSNIYLKSGVVNLFSARLARKGENSKFLMVSLSGIKE